MTPALKDALRRAFRTDDVEGVEMVEDHRNDRVRFTLGNRCIFVTHEVMRRLSPPPPPDPLTEGIKVMVEALWDIEKRRAREEGREPSGSGLFTSTGD